MPKQITIGGKAVDVSDEQFEAINELLEEQRKEINNYEDMVGEKFFLRGVTMYHVGKVKKVVGKFVLLQDASWIPDTGRFMQFIEDGTLNEVEPVGDVFVNMDTVVDFYPWKHPLPENQA